MNRHQQKHACTQCRASKVRCLLDTLTETGKCRRCHNAGTQCIFANVAPRQRRKRTDTRVNELEQQLEALKATVGSKNLPSTSARNNHVDETVAEPSEHRRQLRQPRQQTRPLGSSSARSSKQGDNVSSSHDITAGPDINGDTIPGLVSSTQVSTEYGAQLLHEFVQNILPEYPIILDHDTTDFAALRTERPILLLAMITAGSRGLDPSLFTCLHSKLVSVLAEKVVLLGQRSTELIQATLVMEIWYCPPDDMRHLNFYLWLQIAGTMAQQAGLLPVKHKTDPLTNRRSGQHIDRDGLAHLRNSLAVYLPLSCVAISLRRPMATFLGRGIADSLDVFAQNTHHVNDKRLIAWIQLQLIAEEVQNLLLKLQSQTTGTSNNNSATPNCDIVQVLEERLVSWRQSSAALMNSALRVHFTYCRCKLYELAMMLLRHQRTIGDSNSGGNSINIQSSNSSYIKTMMSLIQVSHSLLDCILQMDIVHYRRCPTVTTVRALYALHELRRLRISLHQYPSSFSSLITEADLSFEFYTSQLDDFFRRAAGTEGFQIPLMALKALEKAKDTVQLFVQSGIGTNLQSSGHALSAINASSDVPDDTAPPANDLEEILTTSVPEVSETRPDYLDTPNIESGMFTSGPNTQLHPSGLYMSRPTHMPSEFELMTMPEATMDWTWMLSDLQMP